MKKKIHYLTLTFMISASLVHGQSTGCGDGNNRYTKAINGETIFYAGNVAEFKVMRESENKLSISDSVKCRFGNDVLIDIVNVKFLDTTLTVDDLVIQSAQNQLKTNLLVIFLSDQIKKIFGRNSVAKINTEDTTRVIEADTVASNVGFGVSTSNGGTIPVFSSSGSTNTNVPSFTSSNPNFIFEPVVTQPVFAPTNGSNSFFQTQSPANSNPFSIFGNQSTQQASTVQANGATAIVAWDPLRVGTNDLVYFESTDANNRHHFLGSSIGFRGSAQITIPDSFAGQERMTVYIKSGTRLVGTYTIALQ